MKNVNIKKSELLQIVTQNKAAHVDAYNIAMENYRVLSIKALTKMLKDAKSGGKIVASTGFYEPQSHVDDYDRVISMLKLSVDDIISLDQQEFSQYVNDNWSWGNQFTTLTSQYSSLVASMK